MFRVKGMEVRRIVLPADRHMDIPNNWLIVGMTNPRADYSKKNRPPEGGRLMTPVEAACAATIRRRESS